MAFDWPQFLQDHNIHYVTDGPNCPKGDVAVKCPFCQDDPSEHMAISIDNAGWHCWRNREHAGKSPVRLIQALVKCSYDQARLLAGHSINIPSNFLEQVQAQISPSTTHAPRVPLKFPHGFKPLRYDKPSARPYLNYLYNRGYGQPKSLTRDYGVHYCISGAFAGRIIFPVYFEGKLVTWTGRTITNDELRYKSLTTTPEKAQKEGTPLAIGPINNYLLWYDDLMRRSGTICLCEGPFDALRINYLANWYEIHATCFFTNTPSIQQIELLHELLPRFERKILLLDKEGTMPQQIKTQRRLSEFKIELGKLPQYAGDPAEITTADDLLQFGA